MGLIKEPLNVDFYTKGKQMTDEDQQRVSNFIREKKELKKKNSLEKASGNLKSEVAMSKDGD